MRAKAVERGQVEDAALQLVGHDDVDMHPERPADEVGQLRSPLAVHLHRYEGSEQQEHGVARLRGTVPGARKSATSCRDARHECLAMLL